MNRMSNVFSQIRVPAFALAALVAACGGKDGAKSEAPRAKNAAAQKSGPVVARVGDAVITADEVRQKLGEQSPFLQARYKDLQHKEEFVQNLIRFEVLAQEAYRKGLDQQPEVQSTLKKVLVQELIRQAFDEKQASYSEAELKAYYDKHIDEFVKPERVRASQIFLAGAQTDKAARAKAKAKAAQLLTELKANEAKAAANHPKRAEYKSTLFADLARANSDDPATQSTGGDLRYLSKEDMARQYTDTFAGAVFALTEPNSLTSLVETPQGFHIARLTNRQQAVNRAFEDQQVKDTIKGRLFREQRTKSFDDYVEKLKKDGNAMIDKDVLATVEVPGAARSPTGSVADAPRAGVKPVAPVAVKPQ